MIRNGSYNIHNRPNYSKIAGRTGNNGGGNFSLGLRAWIILVLLLVFIVGVIYNLAS